MYIPKYFKVKFQSNGKTKSELFPPEIINLGYTDTQLLLMFDDRILKAADRVREIYGSCYINDYDAGLENCGFRLDKNGIGIKDADGAELSQHKFGRALDTHIVKIEKLNLDRKAKIEAYNIVRRDLMKLPEFKGFCFEDNVWWLHIDCRNSDVKIFNP